MPQPNHYPQNDPFTVINGVRVFSGFPYLMTFVVKSFYHFILLPKTWSLETMLEMAELQARRNRLDTWFVFDPDNILKFPAYEPPELVPAPPAWSILWTDRLRPAREIPEDEDLKRRKAQTNEIIENIKKRGGYVFGDLMKGGRQPNEREIRELTGFQPNGVHKGLEQCPKCGYYRGECIDNNPAHRGLLMKVYCPCENDNLCARCCQPLAEYKLNANFYSIKDKGIWHVPGFEAFNHKCPDLKEK